MGKLSTGGWWSSLGFGKRTAAPENDFADMGTAFGLDASMESLPHHDHSTGDNPDSGRPPLDGIGRRRTG